jgi:hypothetical protein
MKLNLKPLILFSLLGLGLHHTRSQTTQTQGARYERCNAVLVQTVDYTRLDSKDFLHYLSEVNESTWNQKKTDASFTGKIFAYFPMSSDMSYSKFDEARRNYFSKINFDTSSELFFQHMYSYLTKEQLDTWKDCMKGNGIFLSALQVTETHITLSVYWFPPPGLTDEAPVSGTLAGGHVVQEGIKDGQLFLPEAKLKANSETSILILRDPYVPLTAAVNVAGAYTDTYVHDSTFTKRIKQLEAQVATLQAKVLQFEDAFRPSDLGGPHEINSSSTGGGYPVVTMTCPPGYYVYGVNYAVQPGGTHGQVYAIKPLIKPFLPSPVEPRR